MRESHHFWDVQCLITKSEGDPVIYGFLVVISALFFL
jgi:hypothetical protein